VGSLSPTSADDFANGVGRGSNLLEGDGEDAKEKDLDGGTGGIPVGGGSGGRVARIWDTIAQNEEVRVKSQKLYVSKRRNFSK